MRRDRASKSSAAPIETEGELDLRALGTALWRKRRWIVIPTIFAALLAFAAVNVITPRYRSEARVLIENRETSYSRPENDRNADRDRTLLDAEAVQSQVQIFQSRDLARKVARDLKLAEYKEFNSGSAAHQIMTALFTLVGFTREPSRKTVEERVLERYYDYLTAYQVEKSRVVAVDFQSEDPELAARIANAIGETGGLGLRNLRVPAEGHLADRRWDAREPRVWADNYAAGDDTTGSDTGRTLRPTIANAFRNGVPSPPCK